MRTVDSPCDAVYYRSFGYCTAAHFKYDKLVKLPELDWSNFKWVHVRESVDSERMTCIIFGKTWKGRTGRFFPKFTIIVACERELP
jgi:hypothetical protein